MSEGRENAQVKKGRNGDQVDGEREFARGGGRRGDSIDRRERERGKRGLQYGSVIDCSLVDSP